MKIFFIPASICFILLLASFSNTSTKSIKFTIDGELRGLKNDSVFLYTTWLNPKDKTLKTDTFTTVAKNGKFTIKGETQEVSNAYMTLDKKGRKNFSFFIENGKIRVRGNADSTEKIRVTGTPENDTYTAAMKREYYFYDSVTVLNNQYKLLTDKNSPEASKLTMGADRLRDSVKQFWIDFTASHPDALTSAIFLYLLQDRIPLEQFEPLYDNVSERVKNNRFCMGVKTAIAAKKRTAIGKAAPEFAVNDLDGKKISLADYKGRYVLLDFWASWCVPCRAESPALKEAYKNYKDKGFTIISVSVDTDNGKWKEAIVKDDLPWTHICQGYDVNGIAKLYGVQPIPDNFLINPEGKIIGRELRGADVNKSLSELIK